MLNLPLTELLLFCRRGRWRRVVLGQTLLKVAWSMFRLQRDRRSVHRDYQSKRLVNSVQAEGNCINTDFHLLLPFDTCVSIKKILINLNFFYARHYIITCMRFLEEVHRFVTAKVCLSKTLKGWHSFIFSSLTILLKKLKPAINLSSQ